MDSKDDAEAVRQAIEYLKQNGCCLYTDDSGVVIEVGVNNDNAADEAARHVGHLRSLRVISFNHTNLTDDGLQNIGRLIELRKLSLPCCSITVDGLKHLGQMKNLESLWLEDIPEFGRRGCEVVSGLTSLRELAIYDDRLSDADLVPLGRLTELRELTLEHCRHVEGTALAHFTNLRHLQYLVLGNGVTDEGLKDVVRLGSIKTLGCSGCITDNGLQALLELPNLGRLMLESRDISDVGMQLVASLPKLEYLDVAATTISDKSVSLLGNCQRLTGLVVLDTNITPEGVKRLKEMLPKCDVVGDQDLAHDKFARK